ncbi:conserved hypothetical protein [Pediculus humanus corporis]|uniref:Endosome-associated-trafficking regulator 1 n=1 Tax=Pediculus humanus subsp. corporis TaxID=121224 RepID=E0VET6_PEDHC|nr:uncharacterized protein Phum_PHUM140090 [Pediculus humanus corporis]EEB11892.1 conserved hypothetical protein [Pediculus humanus corporis]
MAEQDANNSSNSFKNESNPNPENVSGSENEELNPSVNERIIQPENENYEMESYLSSYESPAKKEENPFSFKKFLNQDLSGQRNKGARKKVYPTASLSSTKSHLTDPRSSRSQSEGNSRVIGNNDVSSVLPDFVQDHLVIEQCYLNGSSSINIDNLNLQNLPDLNLEHQNIHFLSNSDRSNNQSRQPLNSYSNNLPDFTLGVRNIGSVSQSHSKSDKLPDFTLNAGTSLEFNNDNNVSFTNKGARRRNNGNEINESSHSNRSRPQMSSSPSVPLDLPSYDNTNESNPNLPNIPFDLTIPVEDKSCGSRCQGPPETVSKSLPDFLSDGPIKKEMDDNLKNNRGNIPLHSNNVTFPETTTTRFEHDRLLREVDSLRCQIVEKNRRIELLESELEHLQSTDQREAASLEFAFKEVENNLKHTTKRAINAEDLVYKLKQENKSLKSEISMLRSENMNLRLGKFESHNLESRESKNHKLAKELRMASNMAENSLRSLLSGIQHLRTIASSMENLSKIPENAEVCETISKRVEQV